MALPMVQSVRSGVARFPFAWCVTVYLPHPLSCVFVIFPRRARPQQNEQRNRMSKKGKRIR